MSNLVIGSVTREGGKIIVDGTSGAGGRCELRSSTNTPLNEGAFSLSNDGRFHVEFATQGGYTASSYIVSVSTANEKAVTMRDSFQGTGNAGNLVQVNQ